MIRTKNRRLAFSFAAVVVFWLAVNLLLAITHWDRLGEERFYSDVFSILNEVLPRAVVPFANARSEHERVNNLGFRGPDTTWEKPAGTMRLVSLGDSSTFGVFVSREETYTARVGARLARVGAWETINCGIPGTNILQHRLQYLYKLYRLQADRVMVYVVPNVREDFHALRRIHDLHGTWRARGSTGWQNFMQRWPLYRLMRNLLKGPKAARIRNQVEMIYQESRTHSQSELFLAGFAEDLRDLRRLITEGGAKPLWIWHINRSVVAEHVSKGTDDREILRDPLSGQPESYYLLLKNFAEKHGDDLVNPYPQAVTARKAGVRVFEDVIHPTAAGHKAIAEAILAVLIPRISGGSSTLTLKP